MAPPPALPDRPGPPGKNRPSYNAPFDRGGTVRYGSSGPTLKTQSQQIDGTPAGAPGVWTCFPSSGQFKYWFCYNPQRHAGAIIFLSGVTLPAAHFCFGGPSKFEKHPLQPLTLIRTDLL